MKIGLILNNGKGAYLQQRLVEAGHEITEMVEGTDLLLVDCDWSWAHPRPAIIDAVEAEGGLVAQYPHGGQPVVQAYDGLATPDPRVRLRLEHGPGSIELARMYGGMEEVERLDQAATGWLFSPTREFEPGREIRNVLFAPMHPNIEGLKGGMNGHVDPAPAANAPAYRQLIESGYDVTVSLVGPYFASGLFPHPRVTVVSNTEMSFQQSFQLVEQADAVVGEGTMAALAVALGKPTVMLGQMPYADFIDGHYQEADHAARDFDYVRYPLDLADASLGELLEQAIHDEDGVVAEWRARFIGDDGAANAVALLERLVSGEVAVQAQSESVVIEGVSAAAGSGG